MADKEDLKFIECCCDDRFEVIKRARAHIIDATNIECSPEEMQVLDNFLFRCWQMGWLKNDFHQLEKENAELKKKLEVREKFLKGKSRLIVEDTFEIERLKAQIEKMKCCQNCKYSYSVNTGGCYDSKCELTGLDCINCKDRWEMKE